MKRVNIALSLALVLLLAALVCVTVLTESEEQGVPDLTDASPKGIPPSARQVRPQVSSSQDVGKPGPVEAVLVSAPEPEDPLFDSRYYTTEVPVVIRFEGQPVDGAVVRGAVVRYLENDTRNHNHPLRGTMEAYAFGLGLSDEDGTYAAAVHYLKSHAASDELVELMAFHPDFGTDHVELPLNDVLELPPDEAVVFDLEKGRTMTGRVVRKETGEPVTGALVTTSMMFRDISVNGIGAITDEDGKFVIAGVRFGNTPVQAQVMYPPADPRQPPDPDYWRKFEAAQLGVRPEVFNAETDTYELGTIEIEKSGERSDR